MPIGMPTVCSRCKIKESEMWRTGTDGEVLCNSCGIKKINGNGGEGKSDSESSKASSKPNSLCGIQQSGPVRKSARLKPSKYKGQYNPKSLATKGKSRRVIFKKNPIKAPDSVATCVTQKYIFFDGIYWQLGDIVSVMDHDGGVYYAQVKGFLQDQYCQKSAVITWLLPTTHSPKDKFDPGTYILGPEEEFPRPMECFEFVCHAPSEYFKSKSSPYPVNSNIPDVAYISTSIGHEICKVPTREEIFGLAGNDKIVLGKGGKVPRGRGGRKPKAEKVEKPQLTVPDIKVEIKEEII